MGTPKQTRTKVERNINKTNTESEQSLGKPSSSCDSSLFVPDRIFFTKDGKLDLDRGAVKYFGTKDLNVVLGTILQLSSIDGKAAEASDLAISYAASLMAGLAPRDTTETMFATQITAIHMSMMNMTTRLNTAQSVWMIGSCERALNKLTRSFVMLVDGLQRYRGVAQTVRIEQVTVNEGEHTVGGSMPKGGNDEKPKQFN